MTQCYKSGDFKKYFNENMKALGLPVPQTFFDTYNAAIANTAILVDTLGSLRKGATIGDLIRSSSGLEKLKVAAAFGAAGYIGAVIGSIAIATGRSFACGNQISDLFVFTNQNNLNFEGLFPLILNNMVIIDEGRPSRSSYGPRIIHSPTSFDYS